MELKVTKSKRRGRFGESLSPNYWKKMVREDDKRSKIIFYVTFSFKAWVAMILQNVFFSSS